MKRKEGQDNEKNHKLRVQYGYRLRGAENDGWDDDLR